MYARPTARRSAIGTAVTKKSLGPVAGSASTPVVGTSVGAGLLLGEVLGEGFAVDDGDEDGDADGLAELEGDAVVDGETLGLTATVPDGAVSVDSPL